MVYNLFSFLSPCNTSNITRPIEKSTICKWHYRPLSRVPVVWFVLHCFLRQHHQHQSYHPFFYPFNSINDFQIPNATCFIFMIDTMLPHREEDNLGNRPHLLRFEFRAPARRQSFSYRFGPLSLLRVPKYQFRGSGVCICLTAHLHCMSMNMYASEYRRYPVLVQMRLTIEVYKFDV